MNINQETGRPELDEYEQRDRTQLIAGLRAMADWYEARPNLPSGYSCDLILWTHSKQELAAVIRECGTLEKSYTKEEESVRLRKRFGPIEFRLLAHKVDTCDRVKVGEVIEPAKPARTLELPAEPEKVVEKFEWRCHESILATSQPAPAEQPAEAMA